MAKNRGRSQAEAQMQGGVGNQTPNKESQSSENAQVHHRAWDVSWGKKGGDE